MADEGSQVGRGVESPGAARLPAPGRGWSRLYPLRGLPHQRQVWAWISFDVANQSFTLLINTLLFSIFFTEVVAANSPNPSTLWSITYAASMLLVVLASPIAGALADERSWKKEALVITGFACAILTCMLGLIRPGQLALAMAIYIPANFAFSIGENFLAAYLPELARREDFGRVSGFSWGCAYAAALLLLILTAAAMQLFGLGAAEQWRPFFVFAGVWFGAFIIPTLLFLRERPTQPSHRGVHILLVGFVRLRESLRHIREFRDLITLMAASLFYGTAMSVIIFFASILAKEFGFDEVRLVVFVGVITVSGVGGTLLPTLYQDRFGHKRMTIALLVLWLLTSLGFAYYAHLHSVSLNPATFPTWPLWLLGNLIGVGLGSLGSANRAFVGFLAPASRTAEVFGVWGMVFKLAAVCTIPFAVVKDRYGTTMSLLVLAGFLVVGLAITLLVDEKRGRAAAEGADRDAGVGA